MSDSDIPRCPWCKSAGHHEGTTTKYDCLSSLGCAHQKQSAACKLLQASVARIRELESAEFRRHALDAVVVAERQRDASAAREAELRAEVAELRVRLASATVPVPSLADYEAAKMEVERLRSQVELTTHFLVAFNRHRARQYVSGDAAKRLREMYRILYPPGIEAANAAKERDDATT